MKDFLDLFSGVLLQPKETLRTAARERKLAASLSLYCLVLFFSFAAQIIANEQKLGQLLIGLPFFLLFTLTLLFFHTAILQLGAEFLGGRGRGLELFIALALANIPYIFSAPLALVDRLAHGLGSVANLALFIWVFALNIIALKEVEGFSTGRAFFTLCLPWLLIVGGLILLFVLLFMVIAVLGLSSALDFPQLMNNLNSL